MLERKHKGINTKVLIVSGLLIAISIILTRVFGIMVPVAGVSALRISFGMIPVYIASFLFGPLMGGLVGMISDLIGFMLNPMGGAYFPGFTLSAILIGIIPGLLMKLVKRFNLGRKLYAFNTTVIVLLTLAAYYAYLVKNDINFNNYFESLRESRHLLVSILVVILLIVFNILFPKYINKKSRNVVERGYSINVIYLSVVLCTVFVTVILNALWLSILFNKGYILFLPSRLILGCIKIPLDTLILYTLLNLTKTIYNENK
ncbi:MAG: folate family ECF transporter S component [Vallitalea sp.]|jgi:ECF transporter S component (folate family)|nr:folate family ECF transporter S component [Vallitalea sp.]